MKRIGAHVSASGGVENAPLNAAKLEAKAFAMFTKNQRQWKAKPLSEGNIKAFKENIKKIGIESKYILPHDSYLINLGHPVEENREKSYDAFVDELKRCEKLGLELLNIHPGSHLRKISEEECTRNISNSINRALKESSGVTVVLETTAGQGSNMGYKFEHLRDIIEQVEDKSRVGVCIDSCHIFAAGYDIRDRESYDKTMEAFETIVGFKYLRAVHLNDAKSEFSSRVDRHNSIGEGNIGLEFFRMLMNDERFEEIPMVLETTNPDIWKEEIELLYSLERAK